MNYFDTLNTDLINLIVSGLGYIDLYNVLKDNIINRNLIDFKYLFSNHRMTRTCGIKTNIILKMVEDDPIYKEPKCYEILYITLLKNAFAYFQNILRKCELFIHDKELYDMFMINDVTNDNVTFMHLGEIISFKYFHISNFIISILLKTFNFYELACYHNLSNIKEIVKYIWTKYKIINILDFSNKGDINFHLNSCVNYIIYLIEEYPYAIKIDQSLKILYKIILIFINNEKIIEACFSFLEKLFDTFDQIKFDGFVLSFKKVRKTLIYTSEIENYKKFCDRLILLCESKGLKCNIN